jgi:small subunit ribosomal protein S17
MAKTLTGVVVSDKTDKTIVVSVQTHKNHPIYRKSYVTSKRFMAHDEKNEAKQGDTVVISETRPLSARKRHTLDKVLDHAAISQDQTVEAITAEPVVEKSKDSSEEKSV